MGPWQSSRFSAVLELVSFSSFPKTVFAYQLFPASLGSLSSLCGYDRYHPNNEMGLHHGTRPYYAKAAQLSLGSPRNRRMRPWQTELTGSWQLCQP